VIPSIGMHLLWSSMFLVFIGMGRIETALAHNNVGLLFL